MGCIVAEFLPILAIVADEVGDFVKGLVGDSVLEWHGWLVGVVMMGAVVFYVGCVVVSVSGGVNLGCCSFTLCLPNGVTRNSEKRRQESETVPIPISC